MIVCLACRIPNRIHEHVRQINILSPTIPNTRVPTTATTTHPGVPPTATTTTNAPNSPSWITLRQGTAFGFSTRMRFDLVVNTFVKEALIRNRLVVHGDGRAWRPLVGVQDLAKAHVACLEAPSSLVAGEIFNVVHRSYQIRDLAEEVAQTLGQLGRPVEIVRGPEPSLVRNYRCLGNKLQDRLNLALPTTPSEAVAALIEMYGSTPIEELGHPKYQNVAWMELLQSARSAYEAMGNIFEPIDSPAPQGEARAAGPVAVEPAVAEPMRQGTRV